MIRSLLFAIVTLAANVAANGGSANAEANAIGERGLSISELFHSAAIYDHGPIIIHAEIQSFAPHPRLLVDEKCGRICKDVISYDVADAISTRTDIKSLDDAPVNNDHRCFVRLKVNVLYKQPIRPAPRPPAGLLVRHVDVVEVLGVRCRRAPGWR